jgi:hypothetical protein
MPDTHHKNGPDLGKTSNIQISNYMSGSILNGVGS